jgi:ATP/ADP translocase
MKSTTRLSAKSIDAVGNSRNPTTPQRNMAVTPTTTKNNNNNNNNNNKNTTIPQTPQTSDAVVATTEPEVYEDAPMNQGLLSKRRKKMTHFASSSQRKNEWMRPYWLGSGLCLLLFAFWLLDSLKDPLFGRLVHGNLDKHQPPAKLCSVFCTLLLVCGMEYLANLRQKQRLANFQVGGGGGGGGGVVQTQEQILDPGGDWNRMSVVERNTNRQTAAAALDDTVSIGIFFQIGIPYSIFFCILAYFVTRFQDIEAERRRPALEYDGGGEEQLHEDTMDKWYILAYALYATIESFGSIAVATFWSYANSTLALGDAERYYGPIVAIAQIGAIGGSTMVASDHWEPPALLVAVSLTIVLQVLLMWVYDRRFPPTSELVVDNTTKNINSNSNSNSNINDDDAATILTWQDDNATLTKPFWSGLYLIFRHYYVLLILGVSCLYEISLTCLDYQMKLLGWERFQEQDAGESSSSSSSFNSDDNNMSFSQFMGHYGQAVNMISLFFSAFIFPWLIRRYGLRVTLRLFPTLLLVVTMVAYVALPGNLAVLFISLSVLKAMTYSVHDPAKEILYIPTSNAVKFRAKFWIDVVGERISKAVGSGFNTFAGSVDRSVQIGGIPSLLSASGLWVVCFYAGKEFDRLLSTGKIVGVDQSRDPSTYHQVAEVEITFGDESIVSTFDASVDHHDFASLSSPTRSSSMIEMSPPKQSQQ